MGVFREFFTGLTNSLKQPLDGIKTDVTTALNNQIDKVRNELYQLTQKLDTTVKNPLGAVKNGIDSITGVLDTKVGSPIKGGLESIVKAGGDIKGSVDKVVASVAAFKNDMGEQLTNIKNAMTTAVGEPLVVINNSLESFSGILSNQVGKAADTVANTIKNPLDSIKELMGGMKEVLDIIGKLLPFSPIGMQVNALRVLSKVNNVGLMDTVYNNMPKEVRDIPAVQKYYKDERATLAAQGNTNLTAALMNPIAKGLAEGVMALERVALPKITGWIKEFGKMYNVPDTEIDRMNKLAASGEFGLNAVVSFILGVTVQPAISVATAPAWEAAGQEFWKTLPVRLLDPGTVVRLKYKGYFTDQQFENELARQGFNKEARKAFLDDYKFVPSPSDVIRWATREAFYEPYVTEYGLDNEYPGELNSYGAVLGIDNKELHYFWRSHWELPSTYQGYEMLHRDVITDKDLDTLFMANDIMPFWREKLKAISYHPYTRVDTRRMFKGGIIDREGVKRSYLDQGYDEEHAENLTLWTVGDVLAKERDLTRANIEKLYQEGQIKRETATEYLKGLRYDDDEVEYLLLLVDIKIADETEKELIGLWTDQFKLHEIDLGGFESNLNTLSITTDKKNRLVAKAKRIELGFVTQPSKTDLMKWLSTGIINDKVFKERMKGLGYRDSDILNYNKQTKTGGET
jgi:hypothetical protein